MSGASSDNQKSPSTPLNGVEGKVAIPRLPNEPPRIHPVRTTSACSACREKKAKCDGQHPRCLNCIQLDRVCTYTVSKRDNQKLQLYSLQRKVEVYEALLGEIIAQATINERVSVNNIIKVRSTRAVYEPVTEQIETLHGISGDILGYPSFRVVDEAPCPSAQLEGLAGPDVCVDARQCKVETANHQGSSSPSECH